VIVPRSCACMCGPDEPCLSLSCRGFGTRLPPADTARAMNTDKPGPAVLRRVDCVRLPVDDLESGLAFYRDALGLELVWRDCDSAGLRMPVDGTEIVIHTGGGGPETDLLVNSADEAARVIAGAGGSVSVAPFDIRIGRCCVVRDPWGNELVLLDCSRGLLRTDERGNVTGNLPPAD